MEITLRWDGEIGDTFITPESLASLQSEYEDCPVDVLDFLQDAIGILSREYDDTLKAWHDLMAAKIKEANAG